MRIVADTHVIMSGFSNPHGYPGSIMIAWKQSLVEIAVSKSILQELRRISTCPYATDTLGWTEQRRRIFFESITKGMITVLPTSQPRVVPADPNDDMWFACAKAASAEYIVTKDKKMLDVRQYEGIEVVKPGYFVNHVLPSLKKTA